MHCQHTELVVSALSLTEILENCPLKISFNNRGVSSEANQTWRHGRGIITRPTGKSWIIENWPVLFSRWRFLPDSTDWPHMHTPVDLHSVLLGETWQLVWVCAV